MKCGDCKFIHITENQQYHDCREDSPRVVVSGFKTNPTSKDVSATVGKLMTVWPRVSVEESGCGKYIPRTK